MLSASAGYGSWVFELDEKYVKLHESRQLSVEYSSKAVYVHFFFTLGTTASIRIAVKKYLLMCCSFRQKM